MERELPSEWRAYRAASGRRSDRPAPLAPVELDALGAIERSWRPIALCEICADPRRAAGAAQALYETGAAAVAAMESPWHETEEERRARHFAWPGRVAWCGSPATLLVADLLLGGAGVEACYVDELLRAASWGPWGEQHNALGHPTVELIQRAAEERIIDAWPRRVFHLGHFVEGAIRRTAIAPLLGPAMAALAEAGVEPPRAVLGALDELGQVPSFERRLRFKGCFEATHFALPLAEEALGLVALTPTFRLLAALAAEVGHAILRRDVCLLSAPPVRVRVDEEERPHALDGPAIAYPDGFSIWAVHGIRVPEKAVLRPEELTVEEIDAERNVEVRRVLIERMTPARFLHESGAEPVHSDELGALFRREMADDEPLVYVRVVNSTREPDGSRKEYFLRVPPQIRTAREAVAWTFGLAAEDYAPERET